MHWFTDSQRLEGQPSCVGVFLEPVTLTTARERCAAFRPSSITDDAQDAVGAYFWHLGTFQHHDIARGSQLMRFVKQIANAKGLLTGRLWTGSAIRGGQFLWFDDSPWTGGNPTGTPAEGVTDGHQVVFSVATPFLEYLGVTELSDTVLPYVCEVDVNLRLVNSATAAATTAVGQLEGAVGRQWRSVCRESFSSNPANAIVACTSRGFDTGRLLPATALSGTPPSSFVSVGSCTGSGAWRLLPPPAPTPRPLPRWCSVPACVSVVCLRWRRRRRRCRLSSFHGLLDSLLFCSLCVAWRGVASTEPLLELCDLQGSVLSSCSEMSTLTVECLLNPAPEAEFPNPGGGDLSTDGSGGLSDSATTVTVVVVVVVGGFAGLVAAAYVVKHVRARRQAKTAVSPVKVTPGADSAPVSVAVAVVPGAPAPSAM
jgi:hypothetical protein